MQEATFYRRIGIESSSPCPIAKLDVRVTSLIFCRNDRRAVADGLVRAADRVPRKALRGDARQFGGRGQTTSVPRKREGIGYRRIRASVAPDAARASATRREGARHLKVGLARGDVRQMHLAPEYRGALFQVASQFNMLEMVGPDVTPEDGVTRYQHDRTQGPACAIAAGAATVYRNYFAPVAGGQGQTAGRQLDGLARIGEALGEALGRLHRRALANAQRLRPV